MSIMHVNQIMNYITRLFNSKIDMTDAGKPGPDYDNQFLTRSLAAYAIHFLSGADPESASQSINDGGTTMVLMRFFTKDHSTFIDTTSTQQV